MARRSDTYDVIIAGAGPAGTSAAIHLARNDVTVLLVEQKKFPRAKLCGEFISPECRSHFEKLGVAEAMMCAKPALLTETVFYSSKGYGVTVPSWWFGGGAAIGLSRAVMDENLLRRAQSLGVEILENTNVTDLIKGADRVLGVRVKTNNDEHEYRALLTIDATGRTRSLTRKFDQLNTLRGRRSKPKLIAFKAHFQGTRVAQGACELYFYRGGYGGLSTVEAGISNFCFITSATDVRRCHSRPEVVLGEIVMRNRRAAYALNGASLFSDWLSVSLDRFGRYRPSPAPGLLAIGDSASFIDPFTGSGMLMALESGELAAQTIVRLRDKLKISSGALEAEYAEKYRRKFDSRFRISGLLRRAAFRPRLAEMSIAICNASERLCSRLAFATRSDEGTNKRLATPFK